MSKVAWVASTAGEVALAVATPKTVLSVVAPSGKTLTVVAFKIDFDGVSSAAEAVLAELCRSTQATSGTSTAVTPRRKRGTASATVASTAAKDYSVEPTVVTLIEDYAVDPNKGLVYVQFPLGREIEEVDGDAILLRLTAPAIVNCRAFIEFEEG